MKKIILISLILIAGYFSFGQGYPIPQKLGNANTLITTDSGGVQANHIVYSFSDTASANLSRYIKFYNGAIIRVDTSLYLRSSGRWVKQAGGGGGTTVTTTTPARNASTSGITINGSGVLQLGIVNATKPGIISTGIDTISGVKKLPDGLVVGKQGTIAPSSIVDIDGGTSKGMLIPRMDSGSMIGISSPATGLNLYNGTTNTNWFFDGTVWRNGGYVKPFYFKSGLTGISGTVDSAKLGGLLDQPTIINTNGYSLNVLGSGVQSTVIGNTAVASGVSSAAYGDNAQATANYGYALGANSLVSAVRGTALGNSTDATGVASLAAGDNAQANCDSCTAIGKDSQITSKYGMALGDSTHGGVVIGGTVVLPSAKFQVNAIDKGLLMPRMTTTQRNAIASPATGLIIYNITTAQFEFWNGSAWVPEFNGGTGVPLSSISAAVATNNINNANFGQAWNWNTLLNGDAFYLYNSTSGTAAGDIKLLKAEVQNLFFSSNDNYYAGHFNSHSTIGAGTGTNIGIYATATSGQNNYAAIFDAGNVGIGTTTPAKKLHTVGTVRHVTLGTASTDTTTYKPVGINSSGDIIGMVNWPGGSGSGVTSVATGLGLLGGTITSTGTVRLDTTYAVTKTSAQTISGAKIFTADVDINKATAVLQIHNTDVNSYAGFSLFKSSGDHVDFGLNSSGAGGDQYLYTNSAIPYKWYNQGTLRMQIDANGNVGIGTTAPVGLLDVYSGAGRYLTINPLSGAYYGLGDLDGAIGNQSHLAIDDNNTVDTLQAGVAGDNIIVLQGGASPLAKIRLGGNDLLSIDGSTGLSTFDAGGGFGIAKFKNSNATESVIIGAGNNAGEAGLYNEGMENIAVYDPTSGGSGGYVYAGGAVTFDKTLSLIGLNSDVYIGTLAGTGSRAVLADATGLLSAPISDRTVKQNIQPISYGLSTINKLKPVSFEYREGWKNYGTGQQIGFIAQDVQRVLPNSVFTTPKTGKLGINKEDILPVLVKAIQELSAKLDAQAKEIKELKKKLRK